MSAAAKKNCYPLNLRSNRSDDCYALAKSDKRGRIAQIYEVASRIAEIGRRPNDAIADQFNDLAEKWRSETQFLSSIQKIVLNPHYQRIIGMGPAVLPYMFKDLRDRGGHWYWALQSIVGQNPAAQTSNLSDAKRLWLDFAVEGGYLR